MLEGLNPGNAYKSIVQRSVLVGVEERRISSNVGASRHLPVPYYVDPPTWYLETDDTPPLSKEVFIAYWGSRHVGEHCPACESKEFDPSTVRDGVIDQLERACKFRGRLGRKECRIYVNDDRDGRNSLLHAARDLKFEEIMQKSLFCPVPRGDSAATKRFYCAVAALCIPVVVSDHFPFPFSERVDYDSFVVRIRERDIADGAVDVYQMLADMDPHRIAQRQRAMEVARRDILYTRESYQAPGQVGAGKLCMPACQKAAWHKGRAVMNLMYALRNLPACHKEKATALEGCDQQVVGSSWHQPVTDWAEIGAGQNRGVAERRSPEAAQLAPGTGAGNSRLDVGDGSSCVSIAPDASDWWCATTCGFGGDMAACPQSMCKCDAAANEQASKDNETAVTPAEAYIAATPQKGRG